MGRKKDHYSFRRNSGNPERSDYRDRGRRFLQPASFRLARNIESLVGGYKNLSFSQGGSTITQQLAKNVFLSSEKTITRKLKELVLAIQMESRYSKDEILNLYLNQIPYGSNAYGSGGRQPNIFSKSANDIDLAESALLAGLTKAPSYYSPWGVIWTRFWPEKRCFKPNGRTRENHGETAG